MVIADIIEGETARKVFPLLERETPTSPLEAIDGTGLTITTVLIKDRYGTVVDTTSDFGWSVQASGTVFYDPDAADMLAANSPFTLRIMLTDGSGKTRWYPNTNKSDAVIQVRLP